LCTALYASVRAYSGSAKRTDDTTFLAMRRVDRAAPAAD
jgi:hypothetical protein